MNKDVSVENMKQVFDLPVILLILLAVETCRLVTAWTNYSSIEENYNKCLFESHDPMAPGKRFRDLPMIENEGNFLKMKREPRLFTFTTNKKDVDVSKLNRILDMTLRTSDLTLKPQIGLSAPKFGL